MTFIFYTLCTHNAYKKNLVVHLYFIFIIIFIAILLQVIGLFHTIDINQPRPYCSTSFSKNIVVLLFIHLIDHLNRITGISPYYKSMVVLCL